MRRLLPLLTLLAFGTYSTFITVQHGYFGFLDLLREPWGPQVLTDLGIACWIAMSYIVPEARKLGIPRWPYVLATVGLGSIGILAYLTHRAWKLARPS